MTAAAAAAVRVLLLLLVAAFVAEVLLLLLCVCFSFTRFELASLFSYYTTPTKPAQITSEYGQHSSSTAPAVNNTRRSHLLRRRTERLGVTAAGTAAVLLLSMPLLLLRHVAFGARFRAGCI